MTQELAATVAFIEKLDPKNLAAWIGEPARSSQAMIVRVRKEREAARLALKPSR